MRLYNVIKPKLNIRNRIINLTDDSYVGQLQKGAQFWGFENLVEGTAPSGTTNNFYVKDQNNNFVSHAGVREGYLPDSIMDFGIDSLLFDPLLKKGEGVTVIIIDSGFNNFSRDEDGPTIIERINCIDSTKDVTDRLGHGTLMANIIGGKSVDRQGLAPNCEIIIIKYRDTENENLAQQFNQAIALANEKILSNPDKFFLINCSNTAKYSARQKEVIDEILTITSHLSNALFFSAAGNGSIFNVDFSRINLVPCYKEGLLSVSSSIKVDQNNEIIYQWNLSSNYWESISINAPGAYRSEFLESKIDTSVFRSSTSNACAFIVGLVALYISQNINEIDKKQKSKDFISAIVKEEFELVQGRQSIVRKINRDNIKQIFLAN